MSFNIPKIHNETQAIYEKFQTSPRAKLAGIAVVLNSMIEVYDLIGKSRESVKIGERGLEQWDKEYKALGARLEFYRTTLTQLEGQLPTWNQEDDQDLHNLLEGPIFTFGNAAMWKEHGWWAKGFLPPPGDRPDLDEVWMLANQISATTEFETNLIHTFWGGMHRTAESALEAGGELVSEVGEAAWEWVKEKAQEAADAAGDFISKHKGAIAMLAAAGIGLLLLTRRK